MNFILVVSIFAAAGLVAAFNMLPRAKPANPRPPDAPPESPRQPPILRDDIGIILVHGIGEQRRFQHLDSQLRGLLRALRSLKIAGEVERVSVDITPSGAAAFAAEHDSWNGGPKPSVTVTIDHALNGAPERTRLQIHEVWWADVNEPYSLAKQFRFWLWGLAAWTLPERRHAGNLGSSDRVMPPKVHGKLWADRLRLWMVGVFFMLLGYSIGTISFLASRIFNLRSPDWLQTITNYLSAVKLYNQQKRYGPGLIWKTEEFLDTIDEPPRVSVRRRMIRAIADVATSDCGRWYVLAHSQGTVVAFNGLMETSYAWPGYLNEERWTKLIAKHLGGKMASGSPLPSPPFMPRRPAWAQPDEIAYRSQIFAKFRGFLTYGSPLQKFAGLWPALVPISRETCFKDGVAWINVYDPLDPVSGKLDGFKDQPPACCPRAVDYGYASHWALLVAHTNYLTHRRNPEGDLATRTVRWMLTDSTAPFAPPPKPHSSGLGTWYPDGPGRAWRRSVAARGWWFCSAGLLAAIGAATMPVILRWTITAVEGIGTTIGNILHGVI